MSGAVSGAARCGFILGSGHSFLILPFPTASAVVCPIPWRNLMRQAWRWYGPDDPVTLDHVRQAGATEIVSALHQYAPGEVWPRAAVAERKALIETAPP